MDFPSNLMRKLELRRENESLRSLPSQNTMIDFSSNDYLGFAQDQELFDKVHEELEIYAPRIGSTGSRLLSGNFELHEALEVQIANFFKAESALLFNSGYDANVGLLSSVPQRGDLIFYDETSHASIRDGIRLSNAKSLKFKHNDLDELRIKLENAGQAVQRYVVVESIYSMDGDVAPLEELASMATTYNFKLIIDEAHSTGVYGSKGDGMVNELNLTASVFARIYTFGKAAGCHGAAVVGSPLLKQYLVNFARSFIYTTAMPPHSVLAIKNSLLLLESTQNRTKLQENIELFKKTSDKLGLDAIFIKSDSAIQCAIISSNAKVKKISLQLNAHNFDVKPIISPTVPIGEERIRFCIHSYNTSADIKEILFLLSTFV
ncbi:aminotransferase class I/II-fold pyridoxal phosphate-dependent enzyme [Lutimonas sp.]|uniref:aminotransferase class I/II-fold pyridoxal phosphate-dependent enzyme n=1 Tax=Lutimonas sp. TaxID=1872403 RepID=UPI003D9BDA4B